jgi:hypothetical protein
MPRKQYLVSISQILLPREAKSVILDIFATTIAVWIGRFLPADKILSGLIHW